jgi:hypothetical protein
VPPAERVPLTESQKNQAIIQAPPLPPEQGGGCDYDALFGGIRSFVNIIADTILNFWQMMDIEGRDISKAARLLSAIPILGNLPVDELATARDFLVDEVIDAYFAYDTPLARDQIACKIFTIVKCQNKCDVNYNDIAQALAELALDVVVPGSVEELWGLITNLIAGFTAPELVYYGSISMAIGALGLGTTALGINFLDLTTMVALGYDEPSSDWQLLCQPCATGWEFVGNVTIINDTGSVLTVRINRGYAVIKRINDEKFRITQMRAVGQRYDYASCWDVIGLQASDYVPICPFPLTSVPAIYSPSINFDVVWLGGNYNDGDIDYEITYNLV